MELLNNPKSTFLLSAGLNVLHQESNEWLSEIAFWRDEISFLYALVVEKTRNSIPVGAKSTIGAIEEELILITGGELDSLQQKVMDHERFLNHLLETRYEDEESYRESHKEIASKVDQFGKRLKLLKRKIFSLIELN